MKFLKIFVVLTVCVGLSVVVSRSQQQAQLRPLPNNSLRVVTTIYPLADFAQNVAGETPVTLTNIIPAGAEPHDYEPSPRDITTVLQADVLVVLGGGFDAWAQALTTDVRQAGGQVVVLTDSLQFAAPHGEDNEEGMAIDPHIWLDPVEAQNITALIRDAMMAADAEHAREYYTNANAYAAQLENIHREYATGLSSCTQNDIIVVHDAFGYLARRYQFEVHAINGLSPEAEPSLKDLADLAQLAKQLGTSTVFFETLVSPELAQTLAGEIEAQTAVLDPIEGLSSEALAEGHTYLSVMRDNLQALRSAMLCQ